MFVAAFFVVVVAIHYLVSGVWACVVVMRERERKRIRRINREDHLQYQEKTHRGSFNSTSSSGKQNIQQYFHLFHLLTGGQKEKKDTAAHQLVSVYVQKKREREKVWS